MKVACIAITLLLWFWYAIGRDKKSVPYWYHPAIHVLYAVCLIGAVMMP